MKEPMTCFQNIFNRFLTVLKYEKSLDDKILKLRMFFFKISFMNLSKANWPPPVLEALKGKPIVERIPTYSVGFCAKSRGKLYQRKKPGNGQSNRPSGACTSVSCLLSVSTMKYLLKFHSDCFEILSADFLWPS